MATGLDPWGARAVGTHTARMFSKLTRHAAENVGQNVEAAPAAAATAVERWMKSKAHRANLLGPYTLAGIDVARDAKGKWFFSLIFTGVWPPADAS